MTRALDITLRRMVFIDPTRSQLLPLTLACIALVGCVSDMTPDWAITKPTVKAIGQRSLATLIRTQGFGDIFRIYYGALRDDLSFHLAYITDSFVGKPEERFDQEYMESLFEHARRSAKDDFPWEEAPPGVEAE